MSLNKSKGSPALAYVIAVLKGDGCCGKEYNKLKQYKTYIFQLTSKDKVFCEEFLKAMNELLSVNYKYIGKCGDGYYRTKIRHKKFGHWYMSLTFRDIKKLAHSYPIQFLKGFYESEGWTDGHRLEISNKDKRFINLLKSLIESLDLIPHVNKGWVKPRNYFMYRIRIYRKEDTQKFLNLIKPCIKSRGKNELK